VLRRTRSGYGESTEMRVEVFARGAVRINRTPPRKDMSAVVGFGIPAVTAGQNSEDRGTNLVVRTAGNPRLWVNSLRHAVGSVATTGPLPVTFDEWVDFAVLTQRLVASSVAILSALGLFLAGIGLLGAVSYSVSERRKELGIRIALGAQRRQLMQMVLRQTLWITGAGVVIGIVLVSASRFYCAPSFTPSVRSNGVYCFRSAPAWW
jgi:FtsX-like permease family protein